MRKILLPFVFCLLASMAWGQSCPTACPTRPAGDNTNAPATTAFVTGAITTGLIRTGIGVHLANDGTATGFNLIPKFGNQIPLYCPATGLWQTYTVATAGLHGDVSNISIDGVAGQAIQGNDLQLTVTIVSVADNGAGLIRIQVADTSLLSGASGYYISGATGTGALPGNINTFTANKTWTVNIIDATHADLVGSTFTTGTYTGNSAFIGVGLPYSVYIKYDSTCTTASFDLSAKQGSSLHTTQGIQVNDGPSGTEPLVGMLVKRAGTIQGGASSELLISWYNPGRSSFTANLTGNTGGTTGSYVRMSGNIEFLFWSDQMPLARSDCSVTGTSALSTIGYSLSASGTYNATIRGETVNQHQTLLDLSPVSPKPINVQFPFNSAPGGFWTVHGWALAAEGTVTLGANCVLTGYSIF